MSFVVNEQIVAPRTRGNHQELYSPSVAPAQKRRSNQLRLPPEEESMVIVRCWIDGSG